MPLKDKRTGEFLKSSIEEILESDYNLVKTSKEYSFNWSAERNNEVYKIFLIGVEQEILGMMALIDYPNEYRIHLNLIEVGASNIGKDKVIDNIAGCLIAFACQLAFLRGYLGFVSLQPKTELIDLYQRKYGFKSYGRILAVEQYNSRLLIQKYLDNENK